MTVDSGFGMVRLFDDFLGTTLDNEDWAANANGGGSVEVVEALPGGVIGLYTDGGNGDINNLFGVDLWVPSIQGTIIFEARVKPVTSIAQGIFVGLSDDNATTTEIPMNLDSGTLTTAATDGVGFVYDSQEGSNWYACSVKNGTDGAQTDCGVGPTLNTYQTFRITVETDGNTRYYIDGKEVATSGAARSAAVTTTAPLCPAIANMGIATAAWVKVDYIFVTAGRDWTVS